MFEWDKALLQPDAKIVDAIRLLNEESLGIVLIVDTNKHLLGTVTDGDIRRGLLRYLTLESKVSEVMAKRPRVAKLDESRTSMLTRMKRDHLTQLPIVDESGRVIGLEVLQNLINTEKFDNPVYIMAGGFGKRLQPLTNDVPKPLLKVGSKPLLQSIIERFAEAGFHDFHISIHYMADMVQEFFGDGSKWGVKIQYILEKSPLGTAGSLGLRAKSDSRLPAIVMNGDVLTNVNFGHLLRFHREHNANATICVREYELQIPYGVIQYEEHFVRDIKEKPVNKYFINAGIYVLEPDILDQLEGKEYMDMPTLLQGRIADQKKVAMFPIHEYWLDIGHIEQYEQAQQDMEKILF